MNSSTTPWVVSEEYRRLQAECEFLLMEKDLAVKMWEQDGQKMESAVLQVHSLRSVLAMVQGRKNITDQKVDASEKDSLGVQIKSLQERLQKLRTKSELREMDVEEVCCGNACQAAIQNVAEQLKAESGQLWQMQQLLDVLYKQVQELHNSRDLWQCKAVRAATQAAALKETEWQQKARSSRRKLWHLQSEVAHLRNQLHLQSNTMLYHETRNESDKRDKIDHPSHEKCGCWTEGEKKNIGINLNIKRRQLNKVMPQRQPNLLDKKCKIRAESVNRSECRKENNGVMQFSKEKKTRQDPHSRNQRLSRSPLQNISNVIVHSPPN